MFGSARRLWGTIGCWLMGVFSPAGLVLLAIVSLGGRKLRFERVLPWALIWSPLLLVSIVAAVVGRYYDMWWALGEFAIGALAGGLLHMSNKTVVLGTILALATLLCANLGERWWAMHSWYSSTAGVVSTRSLNLIGPIERIRGEGYDKAAATRTWSIRGTRAPLEFDFDARIVSGSLQDAWFEGGIDSLVKDRQHQTISLGQDRPWLASSKGSRLYRLALMSESAGGRRYRIKVILDSVSSNRQECGYVFLAAYGTQARASTPVCLLHSPRQFSMTWSVPKRIETKRLAFGIGGFSDGGVLVRYAELQTWRNGDWHRLDHVIPNHVLAAVNWSGRPRGVDPSLYMQPGATWRSFAVAVSQSLLRPPMTVQLFLALPSDVTIETRNVRVTPGRAVRSLTFRPRQGLWFGGFDLAAAAVVALGLVVLTLVESPWLMLLGVALMLVNVGFTGSRGAWIVGVAGSLTAIALAWSTIGSSRFSRYSLPLLLILALIVGVPIAKRVRTMEAASQGVPSRQQIWGTALSALAAHPWSGIGSKAFTAYWERDHPTEALVTHAHNLWLEFGASDGMPGLIAAFLMTGGLLAAAWNRGRVRGLVLVGGVLALNTVDYSLFYSGVLLPLILGLNSLDHGHNEEA